MENSKSQQQVSKEKYGTLTATQDANNDYSSSNSNYSSNKQQQSKTKYGTLTAKSDANNDYQ
jgi:hypothetical protein